MKSPNLTEQLCAEAYDARDKIKELRACLRWALKHADQRAVAISVPDMNHYNARLARCRKALRK